MKFKNLATVSNEFCEYNQWAEDVEKIVHLIVFVLLAMIAYLLVV